MVDTAFAALTQKPPEAIPAWLRAESKAATA